MYKIGTAIGCFIKKLISRKYVLKDLSFLSDKELSTLLTPEFRWNYDTISKMKLLTDKVTKVTNSFLDNKDLEKSLTKDDCGKLYALLFLMNKYMKTNMLHLIKVSKSVFKSAYYYHKYSHNERVIRICDPRRVYNILNILDVVKKEIKNNKKDFITEDFLISNMVYKNEVSKDLI